MPLPANDNTPSTPTLVVDPFTDYHQSAIDDIMSFMPDEDIRVRLIQNINRAIYQEYVRGHADGLEDRNVSPSRPRNPA